MINKILIITTEGCNACDIADNNVTEAISQAKIDIEKEYKDFSLVDKKLLKSQNIKDFPTVLYFVNNEIVHIATGTYPSVVYLRWINIYFKNII